VDRAPEVGRCDDGIDNDQDGLTDQQDVDDCGRIDTDHDGVKDALDNCPNTPNLDQKDTDGDGIGDLCEVLRRTTRSNDPCGGFIQLCPPGQ
jgi:Thrombospondin type 3 repeat